MQEFVTLFLSKRLVSLFLAHLLQTAELFSSITNMFIYGIVLVITCSSNLRVFLLTDNKYLVILLLGELTKTERINTFCLLTISPQPPLSGMFRSTQFMNCISDHCFRKRNYWMWAAESLPISLLCQPIHFLIPFVSIMSWNPMVSHLT